MLKKVLSSHVEKKKNINNHDPYWSRIVPSMVNGDNVSELQSRDCALHLMESKFTPLPLKLIESICPTQPSAVSHYNCICIIQLVIINEIENATTHFKFYHIRDDICG